MKKSEEKSVFFLNGLLIIISCIGLYIGARKIINSKEIKPGQVWIKEYKIKDEEETFQPITIPPDTITIIEIKDGNIKYKLYEDTFICKYSELPLSEDSKLIKK